MATIDEYAVILRDVALAEIAGLIAAEVAMDLGPPMLGARDRLASVIDGVDRHVATSTGPTPYPWRALASLRQELAAAYFQATAVARRLDELRDALLGLGASPTLIPITDSVESGVHLARHRLGKDVELVIDLGTSLRAMAAPGPLTLVVARALLAVACSGDDRRYTLGIRAHRHDGSIVVAIADDREARGNAAQVGEQLSAVISPWGGQVNISATGCGFEIRLQAT